MILITLEKVIIIQNRYLLALQGVTLERYTSTLDTAYIFLLSSLNLFAGIIFSNLNNIFPEAQIKNTEVVVVMLAELFVYQVLLQTGAMIRNSYKMRWDAWKTLFANFSMIFLVLPVIFGIWNLPIQLPTDIVFLAPLIGLFILFTSFTATTLTVVWVADLLYRGFEGAVRRTSPEIASFYSPLIKGSLPNIILFSIAYSFLISAAFYVSLLLQPPYGLVLLASLMVALFLIVFGRVLSGKVLRFITTKKAAKGTS